MTPNKNKYINYRGFKTKAKAQEWADKQRRYNRIVTIQKLKGDIYWPQGEWGVYIYERAKRK